MQSFVPLVQAQELLSNISALEVTVSKLEQELVALHFQLSQERNERRLAEYRLRHPSPQSTSPHSSDIMKLPVYFLLLFFPSLFWTPFDFFLNCSKIVQCLQRKRVRMLLMLMALLLFFELMNVYLLLALQISCCLHCKIFFFFLLRIENILS